MTINTFKKLCLKSNTKKADEINDYFIKLEESLQERQTSCTIFNLKTKNNKIVYNDQVNFNLFNVFKYLFRSYTSMSIKMP